MEDVFSVDSNFLEQRLRNNLTGKRRVDEVQKILDQHYAGYSEQEINRLASEARRYPQVYAYAYITEHKRALVEDFTLVCDVDNDPDYRIVEKVVKAYATENNLGRVDAHIFYADKYLLENDVIISTKLLEAAVTDYRKQYAVNVFIDDDDE